MILGKGQDTLLPLVGRQGVVRWDLRLAICTEVLVLTEARASVLWLDEVERTSCHFVAEFALSR